MNTLIDAKMPLITSVSTSDDALQVELNDGRTITAPLCWYPRLQFATQEERSSWRLIGSGQGIHWDLIDEDISAEGLVTGTPSTENATSLNAWLKQRKSA